MRHRKFARLARLIGSEVSARGHLELLWDVAYENGDEVLGDAGDVEHLARWAGDPGLLARALVESGLLDLDGETHRIHDLWDHAPDYVRKRRSRESERRHKGAKLRQSPDSDRSPPGRRQPDDGRGPPDSAARPPNGDQCPPNGRTRAPAPTQETFPPAGARARDQDQDVAYGYGLDQHLECPDDDPGRRAGDAGATQETPPGTSPSRTPSPGQRVAGEDGSQASLERSSPGTASEQSASPGELTGAEIPPAERPGAAVVRRETGEGGPPAPPAAAITPFQAGQRDRPRPPGERYPVTVQLLDKLEAAGWDASAPKDAVTRAAVERIVAALGVDVAAERLLAMVRDDRAVGVEPRPWLGWHLDVIAGRRKPRAPQAPEPKTPPRDVGCAEWARVLETLRERYRPDLVERWWNPLRGELRDSELVLVAPDEHHARFVADQHLELIGSAARELLGGVQVRVEPAPGLAAAGGAP